MEGKGAQLYEEWHWGVPASSITDWKDPDVDSVLHGGEDGPLIETGRLVELHFREPGRRKDTVVRLNRDEANGSHLSFDPEHPHQRLYIHSHPSFAKRMHEKYRQDDRYENGSKHREVALRRAASLVGGRHATADYPKVDVVPIGILTHVVYATEKKGDGYSFYIHKLGEESGIKPALTIDNRGRLWIAGGNYTSPSPGITD